MVSGSGSEKGGGSEKHEGGGTKAAAKKLPEGVHEVHPYAFKGASKGEPISHHFWHPPPKDLPEAPIHFTRNLMNLELHLGDPRQRLVGMTDAERAWRKKYVLDQHLAPEEPYYVPEFYGNFNPLRRIYRWPWDTLERRVLIPALGFNRGHYTRMIIPKMMIGFVIVSWVYYHCKYHHPTWMNWNRTSVMLIDQPLFHEAKIRKEDPELWKKGIRQYESKDDFWELDFKKRYTHLNLDPPVRP